MISEFAGAGALGLVIGHDAERRFGPPFVRAITYIVVSTIALGSTSCWFAGMSGLIASIAAESLSFTGCYLVLRNHFRRPAWI
jgi:hypothetical protein